MARSLLSLKVLCQASDFHCRIYCYSKSVTWYYLEVIYVILARLSHFETTQSRRTNLVILSSHIIFIFDEVTLWLYLWCDCDCIVQYLYCTFVQFLRLANLRRDAQAFMFPWYSFNYILSDNVSTTLNNTPHFPCMDKI